MTVSFVGAQGAAATTVTIPAHQVGDLILIFAYRDGSNTVPTAPTAGGTVPTWTQIGSSGANTNSSRLHYATATATNTTSGTWTSATELICLVYRGASIGTSAGSSGSATTSIIYPALTLQRTDNSSWVVGVAGHRTATNVEVAPTGMTNRASSGTEAAGHDTNGTVTSWTQRTVTVNASSAFRSWTVELRDKTVSLLADVKAFTVTTNDANLVKGRRLVADNGTFTVTSNGANLLHGAVVQANTRTFTVTRNDAVIRINKVLSASAGSYTISGLDISLHIVKGYDFNPDPGHITLQGIDAGLLVTRRLAAAARAFTVTRNPANLIKPVKVIAATRGFTVTGNTASLNYSGGAASEKKLYYQSVLVDPRKVIVSPSINEDQLVYYIKGFYRIL